ncbi:MAG: hypothetical protein JWM58_515 [Rhizobium sp.]|nr:hypothetical protein [Rhizobium sp.]
MRMILLTGMMSMAAATAQADSSIDIVKTNDSAHSIDYIICSTCAPLRSKKVETPEFTLAPGTQKIELRDVNGELKVFRTEAWLGGSPVTYVSKASTEAIAEHDAAVAAADEQKLPKVTIDNTATTSALTAGDQKSDQIVIDRNTTSAVSADVSGDPPPTTVIKKFNPQDLKLRVD